MRRLLDSDGNFATVFHHDEATDKTIIQTWHDPTAILENNKRLVGHNDGFSPSRELKRIASIPLGIIYQCLAKYGVQPRTWMQWNKHERAQFYGRIYNDPDYSHVRTSETSGQNKAVFQAKTLRPTAIRRR